MNSFRRGDEYVGIIFFPGYKKPVLAIGNQNVIRKVASFNSEEDAEDFCSLLNKWLGIDEEVGD